MPDTPETAAPASAPDLGEASAWVTDSLSTPEPVASVTDEGNDFGLYDDDLNPRPDNLDEELTGVVTNVEDAAPVAAPAAAPGAAAAAPTALTSEQQPWAQYLADRGVPAGVIQLGWSAIEPYARAVTEAYNAREENKRLQAQHATLPVAQPVAPQPAAPTKFEWDDPETIDPRILAFSAAQSQREAALESRLAQFEQQVNQIAPMAPALANVIRASQDSARHNHLQSFQTEIETFAHPEVFGTPQAPNHRAREAVYNFATTILQGRQAADFPTAIQMAYRAIHGQQAVTRAVAQVVEKTQTRQGQVLAKPTAKKTAPAAPQGDMDAIQAVQTFMRQRGMQADIDPFAAERVALS